MRGKSGTNPHNLENLEGLFLFIYLTALLHVTMNRETGSHWAVSEEIHEQRLVLQLQAQLEEMFSDKHLAEDGFLLKHIQKNKEGFVSLKLLTCLKKIKVLTDNWYMTLAASLFSSALEVNTDSTKVRRLLAYPDWLLCSPTSKLLLLWNLPPDWLNPRPRSPQDPHPTLSDRIITKLGSYGTLMGHWVLLPGQDLPKELQCYAKRQKELGQSVCAVVKFNTLAEIRKAYDQLKAEEIESAGNGVHVVSLGYRSAYLISKEQLRDEMSQGDAGVSIERVPEQTDGTNNVELQEVLTKDQDADAAVKMQKALPAGDSPRVPWVARRRNQRLNLQVPKNLVQVIRQPLGPHGTKGFLRTPIA